MPLKLSDVITELENIDLENSEIRTSAENLQASLSYFFEQVKARATWTREELNELRIGSQLTKAQTMLEESLRPKRRRPTD